MKSLQQFKNGFFDRPAVLAAVTEATRKAMSRGGAFVRTDAKGSLRYATKKRAVSKPGNPPIVHRGDTKIGGRSVSLLKEMIFFAYDPSTRSVVVGPTAINSAAKFIRRGQKTVPQILEEGGEIKVVEVFHRGQWKRASIVGAAKARNLPQRVRSAKIAPRPFMVPAMNRVVPKLMPLFKSSLAPVTGNRLQVA
jgi:hypothetical protein